MKAAVAREFGKPLTIEEVPCRPKTAALSLKDSSPSPRLTRRPARAFVFQDKQKPEVVTPEPKRSKARLSAVSLNAAAQSVLVPLTARITAEKFHALTHLAQLRTKNHHF